MGEKRRDIDDEFGSAALDFDDLQDQLEAAQRERFLLEGEVNRLASENRRLSSANEQLRTELRRERIITGSVKKQNEELLSQLGEAGVGHSVTVLPPIPTIGPGQYGHRRPLSTEELAAGDPRNQGSGQSRDIVGEE